LPTATDDATDVFDADRFVEHFRHGGYRTYARRYLDWLRNGAPPPGIVAPTFIRRSHREWIESTLRILL